MKTFFHKLTHDKIFATILLIVFIFFAIVSITSFFKNRSMHYFGTITQINAEQVVIADKKFGTRTFAITPSTNFRLGPKKTQELKVGQEVFIVGTGDAQGQVEAIEVRVFDLKK